MADLEIESLKTLFENLADRLDETTGDEESLAALNGLKDSLRAILKEIQTQGSTTIVKRNAHEFVKEFFDEWKKLDPMGGVQKAIQASASEGGGGGGGGTPGGGTILDELRSGKSGVVGARNDLKKDMGIFGKMTRDSGGILGKAAGAFSSKLGLLGAAVGGASALTKGVIDWGAKQVDSYRTLVSSADGSVSSIQEMNRAALNAGLTVDELAKSMKTGSDGARVLGAVRFAQLNDSVRRATRETGLMGMSLEQLRAGQSDYLERLRNLGTINDTNINKMTQGIISMVRSTDLTASILGKTRDEQLAANAEAARDKTMVASVQAQGIDFNQYTALNEIISNQVGEAGLAIYKDLVATGGIVNQDAAKAAAVNPELLQIITSAVTELKAGRGDQTALATNIKGLGDKLAGDTQRTQAITAIGRTQNGDSAFDTYAQLATSARSVNLDKTRLDNVQKGSRDQGTNALLNFDDIKKRFETNLELAVSKPLVAVMDKFGSNMMTAANQAYNLSDALKGVTNVLDGHESATAKVTAALLGAAFGLTLLNGAAVKLMGTKGLVGMLEGLGKGGAGRVAGSAGAARSGTILSQLMGGGRAAGAAEGIAGAGATRGAAALFGLAGLGVAGAVGVGLGAKSVHDHKGESFFGAKQGEKGLLHSRAGGYAGAAASGAAGGAAIGALFGGVGAAPGALIGAGVGAGSALVADNWDGITSLFTGKKPNQAQAASLGDALDPRKMSSNPQGLLNSDDRNRRPDNTNKPVKSPIDSMADRITASQNQTNSYLKHLVENSSAQLQSAKEELAAARGYYEKMIRSQEDTTRAIRSGGNLV